jgi:signal transduction histidine kinase
VKQVLLNLLSNAIKFTPRGSVTVISTYRRASREIAVAIADTGIGIAPDEQARVFEDFHQVDSSPTRERGGAGLGLSICRRLAVMLGGTIELESKPGEGSTFTLVLPAREAR